MTIITALNRLQRAGDSYSHATAKLHEAVSVVVKAIIVAVPVDVELPRGYRVIRDNSSHELFVVKEPAGMIQGHTLSVSVDFAQDVTDGLLDEIAEFLEERAAHAEVMAARLPHRLHKQN